MPASVAREIVATLTRHGFLAYWVGGCVRDLLLGREPKDYDIATSARPEQVLALFHGAELVGAHFGVVLLPGNVEVATFRSESKYEDGRHPSEVRFESDPQRDAERRDFTINALYFDPLREQVLDFVGGRADLSAGLIRAIGDPAARFAEDHLRLLRALRFAARFDYRIEAETLAAIKQASACLRRISGERILAEMNLLLTGPNLSLVWHYLDGTHLWQALAPGSAGGARLARLRPPVSAALGWAALLENYPEAQKVFALCRFSQQLQAHTRALLRDEELLLRAAALSVPDLKRLLRQPNFPEHLELHRATHGESEVWHYLIEASRRWQPEALWPKPLLTGDDLIALGYAPGPEFRDLLTRVENAQLNDDIRTREEALALIRS